MPGYVDGEQAIMDSDEKLAQWAALFVKAYREDETDAGLTGRPAPAAGVQYSGVTQAARELLQAVDAGGVPAFVTGNLKQIAEDNGIVCTDESTPNEIVEAIRSKVREAASGAAGTADRALSE
ncbi:MAG: hypothetical protein M0Q22_10930 [Sulfuritalea sp.]|jgi:hypothetical protein|nr:hypothetical protein [Sulfuritalea sp.]